MTPRPKILRVRLWIYDSILGTARELRDTFAKGLEMKSSYLRRWQVSWMLHTPLISCSRPLRMRSKTHVKKKGV